MSATPKPILPNRRRRRGVRLRDVMPAAQWRETKPWDGTDQNAAWERLARAGGGLGWRRHTRVPRVTPESAVAPGASESPSVASEPRGPHVSRQSRESLLSAHRGPSEPNGPGVAEGAQRDPIARASDERRAQEAAAVRVLRSPGQLTAHDVAAARLDVAAARLNVSVASLKVT